MKCEHCGKNEVTFVYRSSVNGQVEEKHLCSECAEKLGYSQRLTARNRSMLQNFFADPFGDEFFNSFLSPMSGLTGRRGWLPEDPWDDFFSDMPALGAAPARQEPQKEEKKDDLVGREEQSRFAYLRQLNALRLEMKKAVHQENFERAAELRDQIKALETQHQEQQDSK